MPYAFFLLLNGILFIRPGELVDRLEPFRLVYVAILACMATSYQGMLSQVNSQSLCEHPMTLCVLGLLAAVVLSHLQFGSICGARTSGEGSESVSVVPKVTQKDTKVRPDPNSTSGPISSDAEVGRREENERRAWNDVGSHGRAIVELDNEPLMARSNIERYRSALTGDRAPRTPLEEMFALIGHSLEGKKVLEICCHTCEYGIILASLGADVVSVDISKSLIELAKKRVAFNGLSNRITPIVMSVHAMKFEDGSFDIVFCKAGLHHLDIVAARDEIIRVLKPGGLAILSEPVSLSRMVAALRHYVPVAYAKESPDERPLNSKDLRTFSLPFASCKKVYYRIFSRLDRCIRHQETEILLNRVDRFILKCFPALRYLAGTCVLLLKK